VDLRKLNCTERERERERKREREREREKEEANCVRMWTGFSRGINGS